MSVHELKTWPEPFQAVLDGVKRYEIRKADRPFALGDELLLREWVPRAHGARPQTVGMDGAAHYTGREIRVRVTWMSKGPAWGLPVELCVMSIATIEQGGEL